MVTGTETVRRSKPMHTLRAVAATVLTAAMAFLAAALWGVELFGLTPYAVPPEGAWGSCQAGDLVYLSPREQGSLQPGDTVAYVEADTLSLRLGRVARVEEPGRSILLEAGGRTPVLVHTGYIAGTVAASVPRLGYAVFFLRSAFGRRAVCILILGMLLWLLLPEKGGKRNGIRGMFKKYSQTRRPF